MSWTDAVVVLLALIQFAHTCLLICLRRRVTRAEAVLREHVRRLDDAVMWVSPNHQLPDIKNLEFRR